MVHASVVDRADEPDRGDRGALRTDREGPRDACVDEEVEGRAVAQAMRREHGTLAGRARASSRGCLPTGQGLTASPWVLVLVFAARARLRGQGSGWWGPWPAHLVLTLGAGPTGAGSGLFGPFGAASRAQSWGPASQRFLAPPPRPILSPEPDHLTPARDPRSARSLPTLARPARPSRRRRPHHRAPRRAHPKSQ